MTLRTAADLWNSLNSADRLAPRSHDRQFVADLRAALQIAPSQDIGAYLKRHTVDATSFLIAVLNALQPFGMMLNDIYEMFAEGGVSQSNERLLIEFDFGQGDKVPFDVDAFRRARAIMENLSHAVAQRAYCAEDLRLISNGVFRALRETPGVDTTRPPSLVDMAAKSWIDGHEWPYQTPVPLPDGAPNDSLTQALAPLATLIQQLCQRTSRYTSQNDLRSARRDDEPCPSERAPIHQWSESQLAHAQDDHIARYHLLRGLWYCQQLVPLSHRDNFAEKIEALTNAHSQFVPPQPLSRELEDLLDLPIWKQRSQLYSVWLITLLKRELKQSGERFQLMAEDNGLTFAFRPTLIAKLHVGNDVLELMAELRVASKDIKLAGAGRSQNIQPDYSLLQRLPDKTEKVVYVLEAKQYARANTRNFNEALRDYAKINTHALVALANYGPVPASQPKKLVDLCAQNGDENVSERCQAFAGVTPINAMSTHLLRQHFRCALTEYALPLPRLIVDLSSSMGGVLNTQALDSWPTTAERIADSGMGLILNQHYPEPVSPGQPTRNAMLSLFEKTVNGPKGVYDITQKERGLLMLFTDSGGFHEERNYHDKLAGIIILQSDGSMELRMRKSTESLLRRAIPALIACTRAGESY